MSTKTISIDMEAYERLSRARIHSRESFSKVIKRAKWEVPEKSAAALLERMSSRPPLPTTVLDALERHQREEQPLGEPWTR